MTLRHNCTERQLLAHRLLDAVRAGNDIPYEQIITALIALGEVPE